MDNLTTREREIIKDNLRAFTTNFGEPKIVKVKGYGFYIHYPADDESWIQFCRDINYVDGWLYGVVQGVRCVQFKAQRRETEGYDIQGCSKAI